MRVRPQGKYAGSHQGKRLLPNLRNKEEGDNPTNVASHLQFKRGDYSLQGKRARLRLLEKGNKEKLIWLHHEAEQYIDAYLEVANINDAGAAVFQTLNKNHVLTGKAITRAMEESGRFISRNFSASCSAPFSSICRNRSSQRR